MKTAVILALLGATSARHHHHHRNNLAQGRSDLGEQILGAVSAGPWNYFGGRRSSFAQ